MRERGERDEREDRGLRVCVSGRREGEESNSIVLVSGGSGSTM